MSSSLGVLALNLTILGLAAYSYFGGNDSNPALIAGITRPTLEIADDAVRRGVPFWRRWVSAHDLPKADTDRDEESQPYSAYAEGQSSIASSGRSGQDLEGAATEV